METKRVYYGFKNCKNCTTIMIKTIVHMVSHKLTETAVVPMSGRLLAQLYFQRNTKHRASAVNPVTNKTSISLCPSKYDPASLLVIFISLDFEPNDKQVEH